MAYPYLTTYDFIGSCRISTNTYTAELLEDYIDEFEEKCIRAFLGEAAIASYESNPLPDKWADLMEFNGEWEDDEGDKHYLTGFIEIIKRYVYFNFQKDNWDNTVVGAVQNNDENRVRLSDGSSRAVINLRYNEAIKIYYDEIVPFVRYFNDLTVDILSITSMGAGVYECEVESTLYLSDGDTINLNGTEYVINNLIEDTSFEITDIEKVPAIGVAEYHPYEDVILTKQLRIW